MTLTEIILKHTPSSELSVINSLDRYYSVQIRKYDNSDYLLGEVCACAFFCNTQEEFNGMRNFESKLQEKYKDLLEAENMMLFCEYQDIRGYIFLPHFNSLNLQDLEILINAHILKLKKDLSIEEELIESEPYPEG